MATLDDVAALAGVSKATASRALGRPELVARHTIERVRAAADSLGFQPSRIARALARGRTGLLALVVPSLQNIFFAPIIEGAQAAAEESGNHLTIAVSNLASPADNAALERLASQVDGLILNASQASPEVVRHAESLALTVLIERELSGIPSVVADTPAAFGKLAAEFAARGHTRIVYVGGPDGSWPDSMRTQAVQDALAGKAELTVLGPLPPLAESGIRLAEDVLAARATAVLVYAAPIALGLMYALQLRGIGVPQDIVVSGDARIARALGSSGVPSVDVDGTQIGRQAVELLLRRLDLRALEVRGLPVPAQAAPEQRRLTVPVHWS
ncbi:LacI family DNA-binding transcriptional regulator [Arthrobacter gandavensis]|uniref:LacI family DNA-binding transcriptional regulator n=1 Tax=Arthrobacter gandavensis TaxID=169960 RepID=UPI00189059F5|nr:LacI family DNA-binding transcriptional regulator [Arthrobacter gandavensis]MBF4993271.1 LacI family DNA-binding transcriptional regulator [Arthrobacter gandavensis]